MKNTIFLSLFSDYKSEGLYISYETVYRKVWKVLKGSFVRCLNLKYPETPIFHATVDGKTNQLTAAEIDYNGVRVRVNTLPSQLDFLSNWAASRDVLESESEEFGTPKAKFSPLYVVEFNKLEERLDGTPEETSFMTERNRLKYEDDCCHLDKVNLRNRGARRFVVQIITEYATWFNDLEKTRLEGLLEKCATYKSIASQAKAARSETFSPYAFTPRKTYQPTGLFTKNRKK